MPRGGKRPARPKSRTRNMQSHEDGSGGHRPTGRGAKGADARGLEEEGRRPGRPDVGSAGTELRDASTRRGESPGFTRLPRRWTLTTQLFTREPNRVLWPRATLRLLQGTRQPVLWPGATLRLFTHFYKANHDNPSRPRQPKITRVLLPIWGYFRRRNLRTSSPAKNRIGQRCREVGRRCRPRG